MSSRNVESLSTIIPIAPKSSLEELELRTAVCNCIYLFSHRLKKWPLSEFSIRPYRWNHKVI